MKNPEKYLLDIIARHQPKQLKGQSARIIRLESELQSWAQDCFMGIRESGSHARGTATSVSSNVKLLLLLSNTCHRNAGGIRSCYESLHGYLIERYRDVKKHRVSLRLRLNGMDIDITPARMKMGEPDLHTLYQPEVAKRDFNPLLEDFEDPANNENLLSELMSDQDKRIAIKAAQRALMARTIEDVIEA